MSSVKIRRSNYTIGWHIFYLTRPDVKHAVPPLPSDFLSPPRWLFARRFRSLLLHTCSRRDAMKHPKCRCKKMNGFYWEQRESESDMTGTVSVDMRLCLMCVNTARLYPVASRKRSQRRICVAFQNSLFRPSESRELGIHTYYHCNGSETIIYMPTASARRHPNPTKSVPVARSDCSRRGVSLTHSLHAAEYRDTVYAAF